MATPPAPSLQVAHGGAPSGPTGSPPSTGYLRRPGVWLAVLLVGFSPTLLSFLLTWSRSFQEHGFFLGGLVVWLAWRDRHRIRALADGGLPDLNPVLAALSVGWLLAAIMGVGVATQGLFVVIATVWALVVFGWGARVPVLSMAATMLLAVPAWDVLVPVLQRLTTIMSGSAAMAAGIDAEIGYDTIRISSGLFIVEEGCAGINFLMGGLTLGAIYAHLFVRRWQTQLGVVALAAAAAIVGNWIRVAVLIFLGEATAMQSPFIEDHFWQGWAIFTLLMFPTYALAKRLERRDRRNWSPDEGAADARPGALDERGGSTLSPAPATLLAVAGPVVYGLGTIVPVGSTLDRSPEVFDIDPAWTVAAASTPDRWVPDFRGVDERAEWTVSVDGGVVHASRHYFLDQRPGEELVQFGNDIAPDSLVVSDWYAGSIGPEARLVREVVTRTDAEPRVVWYWYRVGGFDTPFRTKAKLLEILAFFRRTPAAELVTMAVVCEPESCERAAELLRLAAVGPPRG